MEPSQIQEPPEPPAPLSIEERSSTASARIGAYLDAARARLRRRETMEVAAALVRIAAGGVLVACAAGVLSPALDLRACVGLSLAAILVGTVLRLRATHERCDALAAADALAAREPALGDELRSLVELSAAERAGRLVAGRAFLLLLRERLAETVRRAPIVLALPIERARAALLRSVLVSAAGLALVAWMTPRLLPDTWLAIRRGPPAAGAAPATAPIIGDLELELRPPAYTGLPPRVIPASSGDLHALRGTEVRVRARSLVGAVRKAELRVESDAGAVESHVVEIDAGQPGGVPAMRAQFTVGASGGYRFVLSRWTGRITEQGTHRIDLDADLPPRVELRAPADPLELEVPRPVELGYEAEDDFGVATVELVYRVGEGEPKRKALEPERPSPRRARGRFLWELGELEREAPLPSGARVSYWIEAKDNDAVSGAKIGRSRSLTIVLRGKQEPAQIDRERLEALLEATLGALADRLEDRAKDGQHAALAQLAGRYRTVAGDAKGKSTPALQRLAAEVAGRLEQLVEEEARARDPHALGAKIVAELERDVLALDDLRGQRRLEEMARIGEEMKRARDQLKRLFEELKTATSDAQKAELKREIERKLTELEAKMAELRRASADAEGQVPDEFLNREAMNNQEMGRDVDGIRKMLARGDLDQAAAELERMSRSLDQMTGALDRSRKAFRGERDPAAEKAMAEVENELADLAKEEREIEHESRAIEDHAAENAEARGGSLKELRDRLAPKLAELDRRAAEQAGDGHLLGSEMTERLRQRAKAVGRALDGNDLDEAQRMSLDARRIASGMSEQLKGMQAEREAEAQARVGDGPSPQLRRSSRRMAEIEQLARQIEAELDRTDSSRRPSLSEPDRKRLDELSKRQRAAAQRGDELSRRLSQGDQPGMSQMPQGVRGDVDGARQSMSEAGRQLARPAPGRGAESASAAAERLESARKQLSDSKKRGDSEEQGGPNAEQRDEPVRIPGADDSAAPRAFREELLDAMKRGSPKRFEEQVQKYYEELVR